MVIGQHTHHTVNAHPNVAVVSKRDSVIATTHHQHSKGRIAPVSQSLFVSVTHIHAKVFVLHLFFLRHDSVRMRFPDTRK